VTRHQQKELALVVTTVLLSAVLYWWTYAVIGDADLIVVKAVAITVFALLWLGLATFTLGLANSFSSGTTLILLPPLLLIIAGRAHFGVIGAALLLLLFTALARLKITTEIKNRIKYSTVQAFYGGGRYMVFGIIISLAGLAIPYLSDRFTTENIIVPEESIAFLIRPFEGALINLLPQLNQTQVIQTPNPSESIPGSIPEPPVIQTTPDSLSSIVTELINERLSSITRQSPFIAALIVILLMLVTVRLLVPIVVWPVLGLIALFIYIAQQTGFAYILKNEATVETLQL